jgi:hypothetical protein
MRRWLAARRLSLTRKKPRDCIGNSLPGPPNDGFLLDYPLLGELSVRRTGRRLAIQASEEPVHHLGAFLQDRPQLLPVHGLGHVAAGVADQPGDLLDGHPVIGEQRDERADTVTPGTSSRERAQIGPFLRPLRIDLKAVAPEQIGGDVRAIATWA